MQHADAEQCRGELVLAFSSPLEWENWLAAAGSAGVWLKLAKKGCAEVTVTYAEALDIALCFGWIDGQKRPLSDDYWLQRFTPRTPRSKWSKINRARAENLIASGRMRAAGQREVEAAQADGRWAAAYEGQSTAAVPGDLQRALDQDAAAAAFFATLDRANRYAILYRIHEAKSRRPALSAWPASWPCCTTTTPSIRRGRRSRPAREIRPGWSGTGPGFG